MYFKLIVLALLAATCESFFLPGFCTGFPNRIFNGDLVTSAPWVARVITVYNQTGNEIEVVSDCGGSLIAPNWVLSAKHCIPDKNKQYHVSVGNVNFMEGTIIPVSDIYFYEAQSNAHITNDVALLKLSENAPPEITPIQVQFTDDLHYNGQIVTIYGWGITESKNFANLLKQTDLELSSREFCSQHVNEDMICFQPKDTGGCKGDSGGPMVIKIDNEIRLIGIDFGYIETTVYTCPYSASQCSPSLSLQLGAYTSVPYYGQWIESIINNY